MKILVKKKCVVIGVVVIVSALTYFFITNEKASNSLPIVVPNAITSPKITSAKPGETVIQEVQLQNDFEGAKVEKADLLQGCFGKDCIPSIDKPVFESSLEADEWLRPQDIVFAINYQGIVRVYPQRIMNWHEIVNDYYEDTPVAVTFCPLCGSAVAFERTVDGVVTEFGVSGKLHNSDLVMYDRFEGNLWQQITGEAIVGPAARRNEELETIPVISTTWEQWKTEQPQTQVLSRKTGHNRDYGRYPYGTYEQDDRLLFGVEGLNESLPIKEVVYGIRVGNIAKAYPASLFEEETTFVDQVGEVTVEVTSFTDGSVTFINSSSGEEIIATRLFWFAWAAFNPDTELYN